MVRLLFHVSKLAAAAVAMVVVLSVGAWSPSAARADTALASGLPQAPKVSAAGSTVAWSVWDAQVGAWRLQVRNGGITQTLPIAARATPFDVSLGDDGHGGLVASYSRCSDTQTAIEAPHGCSLYYYDFATNAERPIGVAGSSGVSRFDPSMAAGRVAWAQVSDSRPVGAGNRVQIYVQSLAGGTPKLLPGGSENNERGTGPTALQLSASALAFSWNTKGLVLYTGYGDSELRVDRLSGGQILVALDEHGDLGGTEYLSPSFTAGALDYGVATTGEEQGWSFATLGWPSARLALAGAPELLASVATGSAGTTIYSRCTAPPNGAMPMAGSPCEVALAERVSYVEPDRELARPSRPTTVSALRAGSGNWLAFSAYDSTAKAYRLMLREPDGKVTAAPVASRRVPFDVQLGSAGDGHVRAVYSRCATEPRLDAVDGLPLPATGRDCRLYRYDVGSAGERRIPGSGSRFLPSVWNGELAFAMSEAHGRTGVYVGSLTGQGSLRRLAGGPPGTATGLGPRAVALRGSQVALVWEYRDRSGLHSQMRLDSTTGSGRLLESVVSRSGVARELSPSMTGGGLLWARRAAGGHSWFEEYGLPGRRLTTYLAPDPIQAVATTQMSVIGQQAFGTIFYARGEGSGATLRLMARRSLSALIG